MNNLIIVLCFLPVFAFGQLNCKWSIDEIDEFTGVSKLAINTTVKADLRGTIEINFIREDEKYYVSLKCYTEKATEMQIYIGQKIYYRFMDGKVLSLVAKNDISGKEEVNILQRLEVLEIKHQISKEQLKEFASNQVEKYRFELSQRDIEFKVKKSKALKLQKAAACIYKN